MGITAQASCMAIIMLDLVLENRIPPPPFILPQQNTPNFVGRLNYIEKLEETLLNPKTRKLAGIVGVAGTGGIGKSALACYFAEKHRDKFPDGVIGLRVNNKDVDNIAREFARLDGEILGEDDTRDAAAIMQDVFASKRVLLIIDNAEIADVRELHPGGRDCAIIVTTRDRSLPGQIDIPDEQLIDLPVLPSPEALNLLAQFIEMHMLEDECNAINHILELVGNLPLALEIVGKTIRSRLSRDPNFKIEQYANALNLDRLKLRRDKHLNVRLCFYQSIRFLEEDNRHDLINAFAQLSVCANSGFALQTAMATIDENDEFTALENLTELVDLSLLNNAEADSQRFIFHPLLQEFSYELADESNLLKQAKQKHADYFINRVNSDHIDDLEADLDDIVNVAEWMAETRNNNYISFYLKLRFFFNRLGHWHRANQIIRIFINLSEENENWFAVAQFHIQQAKFRLLQGKLSESEKILNDIEKTIQNIEPLLDQERTEAMRLNTLGGVYQRQGKFEKSAAMFQKSYELLIEVEDEHGQAKVLNSLGGVYQRQGKFVDALQAFHQSYELLVKVMDDRGQAMVLNSLGGIYQRQGRFDEAVKVLKKSLVISDNLGNQLDVAMVLNSLGGVYQRQGKFDEAVQTFLQSAIIEEKINNKRGQAMVLNSLGGVYQRLGKFDEAEQTFLQSANIEEKINNRRGKAMVLNSLGRVYELQHKFDEAVSTYLQSYELLVLLSDERGQAMVLNSLGGVYQRQGKFDEAVQAFKQSVEIERKNNNWRGLAMVLTSWGRTLLENNMPEQALIHLKEGFAIDEKLKNKRGLDIVTPILSRALQRIGQNEEAVLICDRAINIAPRNNRLLKLKQHIETFHASAKVIKKKGVIKIILQQQSGFRYGFITPEDNGDDIYFGESQVTSELLPILKKGIAVVAEIELLDRGPRAKRVWQVSG